MCILHQPTNLYGFLDKGPHETSSSQRGQNISSSRDKPEKIKEPIKDFIYFSISGKQKWRRKVTFSTVALELDEWQLPMA